MCLKWPIHFFNERFTSAQLWLFIISVKLETDASDNSLNDIPPTLSPKMPTSTGQSSDRSQSGHPLQNAIKQEPMEVSDTGTEKSRSSPNGKAALSSLLQSKSSVGGDSGGQISLLASRQVTVPTEQWTLSDVCYFLKSHDCASYCDSFVKMVRF